MVIHFHFAVEKGSYGTPNIQSGPEANQDPFMY